MEETNHFFFVAVVAIVAIVCLVALSSIQKDLGAYAVYDYDFPDNTDENIAGLGRSSFDLQLSVVPALPSETGISQNLQHNK
ncbi:hypothetical protein JW968_06895 [Candidatus Woesearchaeota archaeon]|nr:hypothetical protein [Candidatus Woesearchaeota archaeon]